MTIKQNEKIANQILSHYGLNAVQKKNFGILLDIYLNMTNFKEE